MSAPVEIKSQAHLERLARQGTPNALARQGTPKREYVLMVHAFGDGGSDWGHRVTSHRFNYAVAAEEAAAWLRKCSGGDIRAHVIMDG